jgi:hypothetical protein
VSFSISCQQDTFLPPLARVGSCGLYQNTLVEIGRKARGRRENKMEKQRRKDVNLGWKKRRGLRPQPI